MSLSDCLLQHQSNPQTVDQVRESSSFAWYTQAEVLCKSTNANDLSTVQSFPHEYGSHVKAIGLYLYHTNSLKYKWQQLDDARQWCHNGHDGVSNHQPHHCLCNRLFRRRSKKTSKLHVTGLCAGNSPVTCEFPVQMDSNAENVFISWRHHEIEGLNHCVYHDFPTEKYHIKPIWLTYHGKFVFSTRTFYWRVMGFASDSPYGVWWYGSITCLLYAGPLFWKLVLNDSWFVSLT